MAVPTIDEIRERSDLTIEKLIELQRRREGREYKLNVANEASETINSPPSFSWPVFILGMVMSGMIVEIASGIQ